ncbi:FHA domain-containing protein [Mucisphaera sp.]|uniref:FHA domain-containing protein n=1 Tax=Mucisphaera sp. TaxID=2913024 RepID=UPI003D0DA507
MQISLLMFKADGTKREFPLEQGRVFVGRANGCGLRIPLASISRKHCVFEVESDGVLLRDLGSSNGTFHNGERVDEVALAAGDQVAVGPVVFRVLFDGAPADLEPVITVLPKADCARVEGD